MNPIWLIIIFLASFLFLVKSSSALVKSLTGIARLLRFSEYMVAFILMSFATSISELFVGISSAVSNAPSLSLGNIFGANLLNITLVIGIASLIHKGVELESKISRVNFWLIFIISLFPLLLGADGVISRADGAILLISFFIYIWHVLGEKEYFTKTVNHRPKGIAAVTGTARDIIIFFAAVTVLLASSAALVWTGTKIAAMATFTIFSFGAVFVALGTTLPEMAFGIRAALAKHGSMAVGNSLGSIAFNSAFIIGVVSVIRPITISGLSQFFFVASAFIVAFLLFNIFVYSRTFISGREGVFLIAVYAIFIFLEFWFKNGLK
ncbi:MAG: sodium:calcium antiporter [Candidatus Niyogibacteria bacterium]|nr:MAG: sodium:calcium antiporter [Candidatus Niyogibacteria bacterium]